MNKCGIYKITCNDNKKYYIGSSVDIQKRWCRHKRELNRNIHTNKYLQNAWNKYGNNSFTFEVICECCEDTLLIIEQQYLDNTQCYDKSIGFNVCTIVGPPPKPKTSKFILKDPDGIIHEGDNISKFARVHNLNIISLIGLVTGSSKSLSYKGWCLPDTILRTYKINSPEGVVHEIRWNGCSNFAKLHNLHGGELSKVLNGKTKSVKGWTMA